MYTNESHPSLSTQKRLSTETSSDVNQQNDIICLKCGERQRVKKLIEHHYRCLYCNLETAHLDRAENGSIRGIFSWLRQQGEVVNDRYRVSSLLGRGGFAATYLVEDVHLNSKKRALKEIPKMLFNAHETNLLSRLNHPSIPDIVDQFSLNELIYLVLKFGGKRTLESERKKMGGQIPLDKLLPWMKQLCRVLDYLHSQSPPIIHRDLKPSNILLDENNLVTLIDFGIAKYAIDGQETRTLARAVTLGFSPPEQVGGTGTDFRSDIYAMAATFYTAATGIVPSPSHDRLAGKNLIEPSVLVTDFPIKLSNAIMKALDLNMNNRQPTIREFNAAFQFYSEPAFQSQPTDTVHVSRDPLNHEKSNLLSAPIPTMSRWPYNLYRRLLNCVQKKPIRLYSLIVAFTIMTAVGFGYRLHSVNRVSPNDSSIFVPQKNISQTSPPRNENLKDTDESHAKENPETPSNLAPMNKQDSLAKSAFKKRREQIETEPNNPSEKSKYGYRRIHKKPRSISKESYPTSASKKTTVPSRINKAKSWGHNVIVEY